MKLTQAIRDAAERTIVLSVDEARALPGMLGRIAPTMLQYHGFYSATVAGVKTLYIRG
jgi:hypothetical protein